MREPDLRPSSYLTLKPGTPVVDRFGKRVGPVERVLLHTCESFDGIIVRTPVGKRFVDAPEVRRISEAVVALGIAASDVESPHPNPNVGRDGVPSARWGRTDATEADRDAVIDSLKRAYVGDQLSTDELARRVEAAHGAGTLDELDVVLADLTAR